MQIDDLIIKGAKVLITVKAYPKPSGRYEELVCTAGLLNGERWIRIYPVPFRLLNDQKKYPKYAWIQLDLERRLNEDIRPESYRPLKGIDEEIIVLDKIATKNNWRERKDIILKEVYTSMEEIIEESKPPRYKSLATLKPNKILDVKVKETSREWRSDWKQYLLERDLFEEPKKGLRIPVRKMPYTFSYQFTSQDTVKRTMQIEDWEIGALYWKCLESSDKNEEKAVDLVKQKLFELAKKDLYFFVGTTLQYQLKNAPNPFIIIGLFYPPVDKQQYLF